ncbi:cytochrome c-type biogenesis protein [Hyphococcus lacteus]
MKVLLGFVCFLMFATGSIAAEPDEILDDPVLEERAKSIDAQLRCVVCQSQSIAESNAPLAKDLRILVRERISIGESDEAVIDYIVERYGNYVLLKPPVQGNTIFLWVFPALALVLGAIGTVFYLRGITPVTTASLSDEDEAELERIISERG